MHIHLPDGVLPFWLWAVGALAALAFVFVSLYAMRRSPKNNVALIGVFSALMLVAMSIPLALPYHINLTVLAGIILGPYAGFVAAAITNMMLALLGHGGVTVSGLNTLILGFECVAGYYIFRGLGAFGRMGLKMGAGVRGAASTFITLMLSLVLFIGIVAVSGANVGEFLHQHDEGAGSGLDGGLEGANPAEAGGHVGEEEHDAEAAISLSAFAALTVPVSIIGAVLESVIVGAIVAYVSKARPGLLKNA